MQVQYIYLYCCTWSSLSSFPDQWQHYVFVIIGRQAARFSDDFGHNILFYIACSSSTFIVFFSWYTNLSCTCNLSQVNCLKAWVTWPAGTRNLGRCCKSLWATDLLFTSFGSRTYLVRLITVFCSGFCQTVSLSLGEIFLSEEIIRMSHQYYLELLSCLHIMQQGLD